MSNHISEEIPRLLTGDASRDLVLDAAEHLRTCPDCQQELVSAVIAHASLTSAHRFAPEIVSPVRDQMPIGRRDGEPDHELPDLTTLFAQAREESATTSTAPARRHRRRMIAVAAAAAVVVGGGITGGLLATEGSSGPSSRTVSLTAYGTAATPKTSAKITISGNRLTVDATSLPRLDSGHFYELWVTDAKRTRMQSVGSISSNNRADLTVAANVMSKYDDFEVSVQKTNQTRYSNRSVLRGDYG